MKPGGRVTRAGDRAEFASALAGVGVIDAFSHSIETGDIDGDSEDDIVVSGGGNTPVSLKVLRRSDGDVTGDGCNDVAIVDYAAGLSILRSYNCSN